MSFRFQPTGRKREPMASRGPKSNCCKFSTAMKERQRLTERQTGREKERKKERKILKKKDRFCFIFELAFLALSLLKRLPVVVQCCDFRTWNVERRRQRASGFGGGEDSLLPSGSANR